MLYHDLFYFRVKFKFTPTHILTKFYFNTCIYRLNGSYMSYDE